MSTVAPAAPAYGTYAPLTLIPGLMSAADQLMNYGVVHTPAALISAKGQPLQPQPGRSDRLEVSSPFCSLSFPLSLSATACLSNAFVPLFHDQ